MQGFNVGRSVRNVFSQARDYLEDNPPLGIELSKSASQTPEEFVSQIQEEAGSAIEDANRINAPTLSASEVDPEGKFGALQDIRKEKRGRTAANLAPASGASILTS